jgi:hypothetical protein
MLSVLGWRFMAFRSSFSFALRLFWAVSFGMTVDKTKAPPVLSLYRSK